MLERTELVKGIEVSYKVAGEDKPLVILHGWGSSSVSWTKIQENIAAHGYRVVTVDLPGFGRTPAPKQIWGVGEYANFVNQFAEKIGLQKFILVGHSFGGQIAIQFASSFPEKIEKLILISPAAIRYGPSWTGRILAYFAKVVWALIYVFPPNLQDNVRHIAYILLRKRDYVKSYGIMREIFKKVIRQDLRPILHTIQVPTYLIWGDRDKLTHLKDAYIIKESIPNCVLQVVPGHGHNLHAEMPEKLANSIAKFI